MRFHNESANGAIVGEGSGINTSKRSLLAKAKESAEKARSATQQWMRDMYLDEERWYRRQAKQ